MMRLSKLLAYISHETPSYHTGGYESKPIVHESYGPPVKSQLSYIYEPHSAYGTPEYNGKNNIQSFIRIYMKKKFWDEDDKTLIECVGEEKTILRFLPLNMTKDKQTFRIPMNFWSRNFSA